MTGGCWGIRYLSLTHILSHLLTHLLSMGWRDLFFIHSSFTSPPTLTISSLHPGGKYPHSHPHSLHLHPPPTSLLTAGILFFSLFPILIK
jgi:hypothetical protein